VGSLTNNFDYESSADLFPARSKRAKPTYRRFNTAAKAIRFAIEKMPVKLLGGTVLEVNDERIEASA
jgi:hypothetical protein